MVRTRANRIILWPSYFDSSKSRGRGRRVPKSQAVQNPASEEILSAVRSLGISAAIHASKSYPSSWWNREGCVSVEKSLAKTQLIRKVAPVLKGQRQQSNP